MELNIFTAISPLDGRYREKISLLAAYFSEWALIKYRLRVEIEYFISLCEVLPQLKKVDKNCFSALRAIADNFSIEEAKKIKNIEKITNHDVKAVEYYLKEKFDILQLSDVREFVHFGLTSQDINNTAVPMSFRDALRDVYFPALEALTTHLNRLSDEWKEIAMLAHTHGQPASPTRLGKEIKVFVERLNNQLSLLKNIPVSGKFGGATGNFNAHYAAYPTIDWVAFANNLLEKQLGIKRQQTTTQIEHYDMLAASFDTMKRINTILIDLSRDFWMYISMEYFNQTVAKNEVGSSAMPHKVNPIDFENGEGNLGIANAIYEHLSSKLPVSRLQRDLSDSTVLRNIGVPMAHSILAFASIHKGLSKIAVNRKAIDDDLKKNWMVIAEGIQTILRRENYPNPYEALKELTRTGTAVTKETFDAFIDNLQVNNAVKNELRRLTPFSYTGK